MLVVTQPAVFPGHISNSEEKEIKSSQQALENIPGKSGEVHENMDPVVQNGKRDSEEGVTNGEHHEEVAYNRTVAGEKGGSKEDGVKNVRLLSTNVDQADGKMKEVLVKIYDCSVKKPFLGGYRQKDLLQEYHNASAQTQLKPRLHDKVKIWYLRFIAVARDFI